MKKTRKRQPERINYDCMLGRCYNPKNISYPRYGARGIKVCDRWRSSFWAFLEDMGPRPSFPRHTIDRIDSNGDYTPENCRWATYQEQVLNRRIPARLLTYNGETLDLSSWSERTGIPKIILHRRAIERGWDAIRTLTTPYIKRGKVRKAKVLKRPHKRLISYGGQTRCIREWSRLTGINRFTISGRLDRGWTPERSLSTPP